MKHIWIAAPLLIVGGLLLLAAINGVSFSIDSEGVYAFYPATAYFFGSICIALGLAVIVKHKR